MTAARATVRPVTTYEPSRELASRQIIKGGVIRLGTEVYLHTNATHASSGVTGLRVDGKDLVISLDHQPGERVQAALVDEDETMCRLGVVAGISGGGANALVRLYRDGQQISPHDPMFGTTSNLWVAIIVVDPAPEPTP